MDIYLSVNNRADILKIPVLPSEFTISKPQSTDVFDTVSQGELQLIGKSKLKGITISSFFPVRDYSYLRDTSMKGWEYVYKIDTWIEQKIPIRLVITDTPINMAVAVKNFEYTIKTDGDLWYTLVLEEFNLLNSENQQLNEEEFDMEELNKLKEQMEYLIGIMETLANPMIYNYVDENMPEWARGSVQKLVDKGILSGEEGGLNLNYDQLRTITWFDRLGLLD
jgi:hypothetical protein|nr:MAG TPA: tail assembly protein [Caudoviricetes sp.]